MTLMAVGQNSLMIWAAGLKQYGDHQLVHPCCSTRNAQLQDTKKALLEIRRRIENL